MCILAASIIVWPSSAFVSLPPMTLTVVGYDGSTVVLSETDIGNLASYRAFGGYRTSYPSLKGLGNYTGVPINTFCEMIGGIGSGYSLHIIASDGYLTKMTYEQVNGDFITYDNVTGLQVQHNDTLTPILAYHCNDLNLTSGGPLRVAIVGPEGLCTDSTFWAKSVVRLEIHPNLQPMNLTVVNYNKVGTKSGLGNYTGVPINTFCDLVGGLHSYQTLRVTASDNMTANFTYAQVNGDFPTYDSDGRQAIHNGSLVTILAYHFADLNLTSDGPLRFAIIGPEGLYTNSSYWVQKVAKLEILGTPEYTLSVESSPTSVDFTADGESHTTSWSATYSEGSSVSLVMPEIHNVGGARYYWQQWDDGNTSRSRAVTITENITLTACYTGPYYQLTVDSSPVSGITFTIDGTPQTTSYSEWLLEGSHTLAMPETHNEYVWLKWLEGGDTSRTKTVDLTHSITLTGVFEFAVPPHGPTAEFTATPETVNVGESVEFDASSSQPGWNGTQETPITEYRWDFGDGNTATTSAPATYHSFANPGNYYVQLTVYSSGAMPEIDAATRMVTVVYIPVGGYSIPANTHTTAESLMPCFMASMILASAFITIRRRKTCQKED
jgi:PKD repeat protein